MYHCLPCLILRSLFFWYFSVHIYYLFLLGKVLYNQVHYKTGCHYTTKHYPFVLSIKHNENKCKNSLPMPSTPSPSHLCPVNQTEWQHNDFTCKSSISKYNAKAKSTNSKQFKRFTNHAIYCFLPSLYHICPTNQTKLQHKDFHCKIQCKCEGHKLKRTIIKTAI